GVLGSVFHLKTTLPARPLGTGWGLPKSARQLLPPAPTSFPENDEPLTIFAELPLVTRQPSTVPLRTSSTLVPGPVIESAGLIDAVPSTVLQTIVDVETSIFGAPANTEVAPNALRTSAATVPNRTIFRSIRVARAFPRLRESCSICILFSSADFGF